MKFRKLNKEKIKKKTKWWIGKKKEKKRKMFQWVVEKWHCDNSKKRRDVSDVVGGEEGRSLRSGTGNVWHMENRKGGGLQKSSFYKNTKNNKVTDALFFFFFCVPLFLILQKDLVPLVSCSSTHVRLERLHTMFYSRYRQASGLPVGRYIAVRWGSLSSVCWHRDLMCS